MRKMPKVSQEAKDVIVGVGYLVGALFLIVFVFGCGFIAGRFS